MNVTRDSFTGEKNLRQKPVTTPGAGKIAVLDEPSADVLAAQAAAQSRAAERLAINSSDGTEINFLGSSYSGADIKVIAHLYDTVNDKDAKKEEFERQSAIASNVSDGAGNLLAGGIDRLVSQQSTNPEFVLNYTKRREVFVAATGLPFPGGEIADKAVGILINSLLKGNNFTFLGGERMKGIASRLRQQYKELHKNYQRQIDHLATVSGESSSTVALGTLQTLSVQSFREKHAVRATGHAYPKGFTRGTRTIGGSMIFTIFQEHALNKLIRSMSSSKNYGERDSELSTLLPDQLPPIDITIAFANEYGALSEIRLYGLEFVTDGMVMSIEDLLMEGTMNFVARDYDPMTSQGRISTSRLQRGMFNNKDDKDITGSSLLFDNNDYVNYIARAGVRRRLTNR